MEKEYWNRFAGIYDLFMKKDEAAYRQLTALIRHAVRDKDVLELATGTGRVARAISETARSVTATDYSENMLKQAMKGGFPPNVAFEQADATRLYFGDQQFDVVVIINALHIMNEPEKALREISRVLKDDGLLIAPTFTHAETNAAQKLLSGLMTRVTGFRTEHDWSRDEFIDFLRENGWEFVQGRTLKASFPLTYVECVKKELA